MHLLNIHTCLYAGKNLQKAAAPRKEWGTGKNRVLENDQDFADKDSFNKAVKKARKSLKEKVDSAKGEFSSFEEFSNVAVEIDKVLQKLQSEGESQD